jgi:hypothetical protein
MEPGRPFIMLIHDRRGLGCGPGRAKDSPCPLLTALGHLVVHEAELFLVGRRDPPPLKWSALRYGFEPEEDRDGEQEA